MTHKIEALYDFHGRKVFDIVNENLDKVFIESKGRKVRANSFYGILSLGIKNGTMFEIVSNDKKQLNRAIEIFER